MTMRHYFFSTISAVTTCIVATSINAQGFLISEQQLPRVVRISL